MAYKVTEPDRNLSPQTGMARRHWLDAGHYLLAGVFQHVQSFDGPIALPKQPGKTYPQGNDPPWKHRSAEFEGLARTFMIGAPLINERPEVTVGGYKLRDYYANQILRATDPAAPQFVGKISQLAAQYNTPLFQHTAEGAALVLGLLMSRRVIWDKYTKPQKDQIAGVLSDYAHAMTNAHNWRWFNAMMLSFLKLNGYRIDQAVLDDHLSNILTYYAGDGWYRDGSTFDFYSCWAFQFYGPIWCNFFGYAHEPAIAGVIEQRHLELQKTYPMMFGRNGHSQMWGRSIMYRCAASAPLGVSFLLKNPIIDPGQARRIASGNLLQFITRDDLLVDGTPSLGFYGTFEPLVQSYSCAASPFWLAKIFLALHAPADSPFWTARENDGDWEKLGKGSQTIALDGPGLALTHDGKSGAAELRPGKAPGKSNSSYTRLVYSTEFYGEEDAPSGATACAFSVKHLNSPTMPFLAHGNVRYGGYRDGVLYRQVEIPGWMSRADLAEITIPGGVIRADRLCLAVGHELRLGHFPLPHYDGVAAEVSRRTVEGRPAIIAAHGRRALAMVIYRGWDELDSETHTGLNPEAKDSTVIFARRTRAQHHATFDLAVTVLLHRTDGADFTDEELSPIESMEYLPLAPSGSPAGLKLTLKTGRHYLVDFTTLAGDVST